MRSIPEGLPGKKLDHGLVSVVAASAAKEELQYTPYQNWFSRLVQLKSTRDCNAMCMAY